MKTILLHPTDFFYFLRKLLKIVCIWVKSNLFNSKINTFLTLIIFLVLFFLLPSAFHWFIFDAVWSSSKGINACEIARGKGACWMVISEKYRFMLFGVYPYEQQWRAALATIILCALLLISALRYFWKFSLLISIWIVGILLVFWLMGGGLWLEDVRTEQWGGLPVTLMLAIFGIFFAFPLGVLLALGRSSNMPIIHHLSVIYIEGIRGVPLITLLFMASLMFSLFLPQGMRIDQLLRAQVAIILFVAAYLAEAVRGGLQALPKGQSEAARALGLSYWKETSLVILPQALRISIAPIVNSFISLFKDTSLVMIVAIYDFSYAVKKSIESDFAWKPYFIEAFFFSILIYWVFCFSISKYSLYLERSLHNGKAFSNL